MTALNAVKTKTANAEHYQTLKAYLNGHFAICFLLGLFQFTSKPFLDVV